MAWPGTIQFTRERTVLVKQEWQKEKEEEKEDKKEEGEEKEDKKEEEEEEEKPCKDKTREIEIKVVKKPQEEIKLENPRLVVGDIWPRRKRTDITKLYH